MTRAMATKGDPLEIKLVQQLAELEALLAEEYDAIRARDLARLEMITRDKQFLVDGINLTSTAMGTTLAGLISGDDSPAASGNRIRALLTRCQRANRTNGGAIETSHSFTTSLLDVLRGRVPGERTYTARGRLGSCTETSAFVHV